MEKSWLQEGDPVDWKDFEQASASGKEILERLAGDRSLLRFLIFTAHERGDLAEVGTWGGDGGEIELHADESKGVFVYLHIGLTDHDGKSLSQGCSYVQKVLTGAYRHVWYAEDGHVSYVADEQPPGLYGMRGGLTHSLSWRGGSTALVLREERVAVGEVNGGGLTEDEYVTLQHRADSAGIV